MIYYHIMLQVWQPLLPDDLRLRSFLHNAFDSPPLTRTTLDVPRSLRKHLIRKRKANEAKSFRAAVVVSVNAQSIIFIRLVTLYLFIYYYYFIIIPDRLELILNILLPPPPSAYYNIGSI